MIIEKNISSTLLNKIIYYFFLLLLGTALLFISAKIKVPFYPVPMTMQTFVVMLFGIFFGWKRACLVVFAYLVEGAFGLPVFAGTPEKGLGLTYITGPTGGYLLGFLLTAYLSGKFNFNTNITLRIFKLILSVTPIYLFGCLWLGYIVGWEKPIFSIGLTPFILSECFKILLLSLLIPKISYLNRLSR